MVATAGFEPAIAWMKTMCPRPLDDVALVIIITNYLKITRVANLHVIVCFAIWRRWVEAGCS